VTDDAFRVPLLFEYVATFSWAVSGTLVAIRKQFDVTGVFVIAMLSSSGGGLIRDAIFLQQTPIFLLEPFYLPLVATTTLIMVLFTRNRIQVIRDDTAQKLEDLIDALGTPAFAVIGMQMARERGIPPLGVIFLGAVNGLGGGLLRDVVVRDVPALLRPGEFVTLMLVIACELFRVLAYRFEVNPTAAAWITVSVFFGLRMMAIRFNWRTRSVRSAGEPSGSSIRSGEAAVSDRSTNGASTTDHDRP
jgi:uncharacterized membrane protein YeiH